ncbi:MAG TPA: phage major capsid protein, partial [Burkholderiales bacterium]|nr:phage major capsid protein [Burkholderiales bacterium]
MSANSAPWLDSVRMDEIRRGQFDREAVFERATLNREARTVDLAYSSEQPHERWFGMEVLSHEPGAADLRRLNGGANLLVNHDPTDWVGVVERARVDPDRKGRATVRFGNSARAEEVWRDVQDGILRSVSFGYRIDDVKLLKENRNGPDEYLVTRYTPFEISLVTMPADATVGVGRSIDPTAATPAATLKGANMAEQQNGGSPATESAPNLVREHIASEATIRAQAMRDMAKRNADMRALGAKFARWGGNDLAAKAVEDANITFDQFREQVLSLVESRQTQSDALSQVPADPRSIGAPDSGAAPYGMGARDMIASANLQVFRGIGKVLNKPDHEIAYRAGMWARGVIFGDPSALRWCKDACVQLQQGQLTPVSTRTMTEGVFTSAGWLVPVEMETAIISNREQYGVARRICNVIPMGTATMTIPRVTSDITAYFVGEGNTGTASDSGGDQVQLNLKDL